MDNTSEVQVPPIEEIGTNIVVQPEEVKSVKIKSSGIEKTLKESLNLCQESLENEIPEQNFEKILKIIEKEVMKKKEYYLLFQLLEKTKKLYSEGGQNDESQKKNNFIEIQNDLIGIKNTFENKKKTLSKKQNDEKEMNEIKPDEIKNSLTSPKKKIKKSKNKKQKEKEAEVLAKIKKENEQMNVELDLVEAECQSPKLDINNEMIVTSPLKLDKSDEAENDLKSKEHTAKKSKENPEKKTKAEKDVSKNKSISHYFGRKSELNLNSQSNLNNNSKSNNSSKEKVEITEINDPEVAPQMIVDSDETSRPSAPDMFYELKSGKARLNFTKEYLEQSNKQSLDIYNADPSNLFNNYYDKLKSYYNLKIPKKIDRTRKRRVIFIHDSFMSNRKFSDKNSLVINPRNPFKKDEHMIDYEKDSEDEFLEENAEDIKSNENSGDEEELNEEEEDEEKWIVPDGHLSEDEVSEQEEQVNLEKDNKNKSKSLMDILEVRKNYNKPVIIDFSVKTADIRVKNAGDMLKARIFMIRVEEPEEESKECFEFPIKIKSKSKNIEVGKKGINFIIKDRLLEVVKEIHLSFMSKEFLVKLINEKYPQISKKQIEIFFRDYCSRTKGISQKNQFIVSKEILIPLNISENEMLELYKNQNEFYEQKKKEKKLENELNTQAANTLVKELQFKQNINNFKTNDDAPIFNLGNIANDISSLNITSPISKEAFLESAVNAASAVSAVSVVTNEQEGITKKKRTYNKKPYVEGSEQQSRKKKVKVEKPEKVDKGENENSYKILKSSKKGERKKKLTSSSAKKLRTSSAKKIDAGQKTLSFNNINISQFDLSKIDIDSRKSDNKELLTNSEIEKAGLNFN